MAELKKVDLNQAAPTTTPVINQAASQSTLKPVKMANNQTVKINLLFPIIALFLGVGSGYGIYALTASKSTSVNVPGARTVEGTLKVGDIIGLDDQKNFPDTADGVVEKGGFEGEGSHKLLRAGGPSQTVYLTSTVVDLDALVGHKVRVQGQTFDAQKVAWLMDIGQVEVLELNAPKPE